jgi:hypothetical protein
MHAKRILIKFRNFIKKNFLIIEFKKWKFCVNSLKKYFKTPISNHNKKNFLNWRKVRAFGTLSNRVINHSSFMWKSLKIKDFQKIMDLITNSSFMFIERKAKTPSIVLYNTYHVYWSEIERKRKNSKRILIYS